MFEALSIQAIKKALLGWLVFVFGSLSIAIACTAMAGTPDDPPKPTGPCGCGALHCEQECSFCCGEGGMEACKKNPAPTNPTR